VPGRASGRKTFLGFKEQIPKNSNFLFKAIRGKRWMWGRTVQPVRAWKNGR